MLKVGHGFSMFFFPLKVCLLLWMVAFCSLKQTTNMLYSGLEFFKLCAIFQQSLYQS